MIPNMIPFICFPSKHFKLHIEGNKHVESVCDDFLEMEYTVKPIFSSHLKIDKAKVLMENGSLMKV